MNNNSLLQNLIGKTPKDVLGPKYQQAKVIAIAEVQRGADVPSQLDQMKGPVSRAAAGSILILAVKL